MFVGLVVADDCSRRRVSMRRTVAMTMVGQLFLSSRASLPLSGSGASAINLVLRKPLSRTETPHYDCASAEAGVDVPLDG